MRVLLLSRYTRLGASSRMRCFQYIPLLAQYGIHVDVQSLYDDRYLMNLYGANRRRWHNILTNYLRRITALFTLGQYDLLWIEQELFPWLPPLAEWLLVKCKVPYVVDYDDAIFHRYDLHRQPLIRRILGRKIDFIMSRAETVIAGNRYLSKRAVEAGARRVAIIPTVIDLERYVPRPNDERKRLTIGWIGSPATYPFFESVSPLLVDLVKRFPIRVEVVGGLETGRQGAWPFTYHRWCEALEVHRLNQFDIGIMPLPDTPWTRGKCGYKLIQYMACSIPVVASKVGANIDIVESGKNGFLVSTTKEWIDAIECLVTDTVLRRTMGQQGRRRVEARYHLGRTLPVLRRCFFQSIR